jgi:hypothetical protein
MSGFVKDVSAGEMFFIALNEIRPPFIIQLALEGHGTPTPESLYEALRQTTEANPGCSLRLDQSGDEPTWVLGPAPTLTILDEPEFTGDSGDLAPFLMWPLDAYTGPSCELLFVQGKNSNFMVFRAVHAVMDGQGTLLWVKDFMRCLRGEKPVGHRSTLSVDRLIRETKTAARPAPKADALHPFGPAKSDSQGTFHWRRIIVDRVLDSGAVGRIAVALAARARSSQEGTVRINLPTDLRHYRPEEQTTGNFFNSLFIEVPPGSAAEMIGLRVIQMLYKHEGKKTVGIFAGEEVGSLALHRTKVLWDLAHLHDTGRYAFSATLSHLGNLKSAALSAPSFATRTAFFVPLVGDSGCVVSMNGFEDNCVACVGLSERFLGSGQLDEFAALVQSALDGDGPDEQVE